MLRLRAGESRVSPASAQLLDGYCAAGLRGAGRPHCWDSGAEKHIIQSDFPKQKLCYREKRDVTVQLCHRRLAVLLRFFLGEHETLKHSL